MSEPNPSGLTWDDMNLTWDEANFTWDDTKTWTRVPKSKKVFTPPYKRHDE